jgi:hypothetical protein
VRELAAISVLALGGRIKPKERIGEEHRRLKGRKRNNNGNKNN